MGFPEGEGSRGSGNGSDLDYQRFGGQQLQGIALFPEQ
jgi:hypothetical protein